MARKQGAGGLKTNEVDEEGKVDERSISRSLDFEVAEEDVGSEEGDGFVDDIFLGWEKHKGAKKKVKGARRRALFMLKRRERERTGRAGRGRASRARLQGQHGSAAGFLKGAIVGIEVLRVVRRLDWTSKRTGDEHKEDEGYRHTKKRE